MVQGCLCTYRYMTYGAEPIAQLRCPLPRGHTELSARTWTSVTPLPVTHLLGYQSGTGRLDTAAPVRPGHRPQVTATSCPDCRQARTS